MAVDYKLRPIVIYGSFTQTSPEYKGTHITICRTKMFEREHGSIFEHYIRNNPTRGLIWWVQDYSSYHVSLIRGDDYGKYFLGIHQIKLMDAPNASDEVLINLTKRIYPPYNEEGDPKI